MIKQNDGCKSKVLLHCLRTFYVSQCPDDICGFDLFQIEIDIEPTDKVRKYLCYIQPGHRKFVQLIVFSQQCSNIVGILSHAMHINTVKDTILIVNFI